MPAKQYMFEAQETDPRITAAQHWNDMRDELNATRDALESANAHETAQAAMIDMLRKELADSKATCTVIERSNTVMRTKLQAAGMLVLDALKTDEIERGTAVSEYAVKNNVHPIQAEPPAEPQDAKPAFLRTAMPANQFSSANGAT
jgi:hypothetical protein